MYGFYWIWVKLETSSIQIRWTVLLDMRKVRSSIYVSDGLLDRDKVRNKDFGSACEPTFLYKRKYCQKTQGSVHPATWHAEANRSSIKGVWYSQACFFSFLMMEQKFYTGLCVGRELQPVLTPWGTQLGNGTDVDLSLGRWSLLGPDLHFKQREEPWEGLTHGTGVVEHAYG